MKISGHNTDSYGAPENIMDTEDLGIAREFMERRMKMAEAVTEVQGAVQDGIKLSPSKRLKASNDPDLYNSR